MPDRLLVTDNMDALFATPSLDHVTSEDYCNMHSDFHKSDA